MIPEFDERGYLPPGIYCATLEEVALRFGTQSEVRRAQTESLRWLVKVARAGGAERLVLNGSYTTDTAEPNDVDCVILIAPAFAPNSVEATELLQGIPFLDIYLVEMKDFLFYTKTFFATDRHLGAKGMVEVLL